MITSIDHVAIAVPQGQLDNMIETYKKMGFSVHHEENVYGTDQVREVMMRVGESDSYLQLLEPLTPDSPVAKQVEKNNGRAAIAHIAFRTADILATFGEMKDGGIQIIDTEPRRGGSGATVFFTHPKSTSVLLEVVEPGGH
ncbi:MAG TPA: VOC family protein [Fimbriimonas sp.]